MWKTDPSSWDINKNHKANHRKIRYQWTLQTLYRKGYLYYLIYNISQIWHPFVSTASFLLSNCGLRAAVEINKHVNVGYGNPKLWSRLSCSRWAVQSCREPPRRVYFDLFSYYKFFKDRRLFPRMRRDLATRRRNPCQLPGDVTRLKARFRPCAYLLFNTGLSPCPCGSFISPSLSGPSAPCPPTGARGENAPGGWREARVCLSRCLFGQTPGGLRMSPSERRPRW